MITIEIQEVDNGFILNLFDSEAPSETDEHTHYENLKTILDKIVLYYEAILAFRSDKEEI